MSDETNRASPPDEALARRVQQGDVAALDALVERYLRPVHAVASSYMREPSDVEDAVQDTFLRVIKSMGSYDATRPFAPWLYEVARNVARGKISRNARHIAEGIDTVQHVDSAARPDAVAEASDIRARVDAALLLLPEQQRISFRLHDVEGYDTNDVARMMGLAVGTVRSHLYYARRSLRAQLKDVLTEAESS